MNLNILKTYIDNNTNYNSFIKHDTLFVKRNNSMVFIDSKVFSITRINENEFMFKFLNKNKINLERVIEYIKQKNLVGIAKIYRTQKYYIMLFDNSFDYIRLFVSDSNYLHVIFKKY